MVTERVKMLKEKLLSFQPEIDLEPARILTEGFKEAAGLPVVLCKAHAFRKQCAEKSVFINEGELIIGSCGSKTRTGIISADGSWAVLAEELDTISTRPCDPFILRDQDRKTFLEIIQPYWLGRSTREMWKRQIPDDVKRLQDNGAILVDSKGSRGFGEVTAGYKWLLEAGVKGILQVIKERKAKLDTAIPGDYEKQVYLQALETVAEGLVILANRHADLAETQAAKERDAKRKKELETIAAICRNVPENPATNFWEALQAICFYQNCLIMEQNAASYNPGRLDQYLWPYYKNDIDSGRMTSDQAQELLDCLWIKFSEPCFFTDESTAGFSAGYPMFQNVSVGGVNTNGDDAVNELSYLILQATMDVQLYQPSLSVRYSMAKNSDHFLRKVVDLISLGTGFPAFFNDETGIQMIQNKGIPLREALDWNPCGCVETNLEGRLRGVTDMTEINLGSVIELAMTDGKSRKTGHFISEHTGDPKTFTSYEEFEAAVKKQAAYLIRRCITSSHIIDDICCLHRPVPVLSFTFKECIENCKDYSTGGAKYNIGNGTILIGVADLINSMAAVRQLIFEDKTVIMEVLCQALANNFEGYESVQELCLKVPKYGNDNPKVDDIAGEMFTFLADEIEGYSSKFGKMTPGILPVTGNIAFGKEVGALPSGRLAWKPLADGLSPSGGTDVEGPTAVLKSVSKIPHARFVQGTLLNLKVEPELVETDKGKAQVMALLKSMCTLGIHHVQFNVISREKLLLAQKYPEEYKGLLIRVAGYTAYFVELDKEVQDDIISRTTQKGIMGCQCQN
ncbi:glycyl radical protein [Aminipila terrae]|uniref:Formate C-acetyltransferase/glycerol dehydratase family glycyl radical enzyme n=1 Tax=Aminipila terrae TaxID=2697030 RepID=A0A6P1MMC5_9FIRM|nr:formate C-acetyltransferase/glycerol dehydratase family glycyl radical enzyme [Aminipila terrae]QHI72155.1 formate C-acetyltransferase/glycerol dehydratase family glycyl radical enzyme [Aminipila terrae]